VLELVDVHEAVGFVLTVRRLWDARWRPWLAAFFFVPLAINLLFFISAASALESPRAPWHD
jgi:hypothetical protein